MDAELIVPVVFFLTAGAAFVFYILARNKERLARIEKGLDTVSVSRQPLHRQKVFTAGLFMVGVALGLLVIFLIEAITGADLEGSSFVASILLFGGLSLIASIFIKVKEDR